jgi:NADPH:quinone reductase-like Zn-dependent oxidoreductase
MTAGGEAADRALSAMREGGRVAYPNGVEPAPRVRPGVRLSNYEVVVDPKTSDKLNRLIEAGPFEVHVARTFRLDQAAAAHKALEEHYLGKFALRLRQEEHEVG